MPHLPLIRVPDQDRQRLYESILDGEMDDGFHVRPVPTTPPRNLRNVTRIGARLWIATSFDEGGCKVVMVADSRTQAVFRPESWDDATDTQIDVEYQQRWFKDLCKRQGRKPHQGAILGCRWDEEEHLLERKMTERGHWVLYIDGLKGESGVLPTSADLAWLDSEWCMIEPTPLNEWCRRPAGVVIGLGQRCVA